jgi:hypothetical protein
MSLAAGVCLCGVLGMARPRFFDRYAPIALSLLFFTLLFRDEMALNRLESRIGAVLGQLPPSQRVVNSLNDPDLRVNALAHMVDRACIGRCFSYSNYEPSTAQFRIRAVRENPLVVSRYADSWALQNGTYVVLDRDLPLYAVDMDNSGAVILRRLKPGTKSGSTVWTLL